MALDITKLTLGEVAKIEELSDMPISALGDEDRPKGKALAALFFVAKRREDPKFTWNQALDVPSDEATAFLGLGDEEEAPDPLASSDAPAPRTKKQTAKK